MTMQINRLKIVTKTTDGDYGVDIPFKNGLFLLRVENSNGKSTCMNAIAFALGMERALGLGGAKVPFPPALTKVLITKENKEVFVHSSYVLLEIENSEGKKATLKRNITGIEDENNIHIYLSSIDSIGLVKSTPYFLHREGDTSRELGFFHWIANFLGWNLPSVPNHNGKETPLYPSVIFPTWFVEQKKGWSSIQATTPVQFGIKEPKKRAIEFILSLNVNENINKRSQIKSEIEDLINQWKIVKRKAELSAGKVSAVVTGISEQPESKFDQYKIDLIFKEDDKIFSIADLKSALVEQLKQLNSKNIILENNLELELATIEKISENTDSIKKLELRLQQIGDEKSYILYQIHSTTGRIENLIEDKRKYEDLKKVADSDVFSNTNLLVNECPTCGANYSDNLVDLSTKDNLMTYDNSLVFIKEQIKAFEFVLFDCQKQLEFKKAEQSNVEGGIAELKSENNKLRDSKNPSMAIQEAYLRAKINLENKIEDIDQAISEIIQTRLDLDTLHIRFKRLQAARKLLPTNILSQEDTRKLASLNSGLVSRLEKYTFSSFSPELIEISRENYQPTREGYDIGFDTSASDGIRIIWGYLISLFAVGHEFSINHPGVVIFDEPRQQEANKVSFAELLKDAAQTSKNGGQIIFATSEEESVLRAALEGEQYTIAAFDKVDGKLIRKFPISA